MITFYIRFFLIRKNILLLSIIISNKLKIEKTKKFNLQLLNLFLISCIYQENILCFDISLKYV
jgi:hypothetical protein